MTTKTMGPSTVSEQETVTEYHADGTVKSISEITRPKQFSSSMMTGMNITNFNKRKRAGELLPHTPFEQESINTYWSTGTADYIRPNGTRQVRDAMHHHTDLSQVYSTIDTEAVLQKVDFDYFVEQAAAAIYEGNGMDLSTFAADLLDVRKLVVNGLTKLLKADFPENLYDTAGAWLEYRYGWRTLMYDLDDLLGIFDNLKAHRSRFSEKAGTSFGTIETVTSQFSTSSGTYETKDTIEYGVSVRGSVVADMIPTPFRASPAITAWEKVPFSFVVDRFVSVGQWLSTLEFNAEVKAYTASYGAKLWASSTREIEIVNWASGYSGEYYSRYITEYERSFRTPTTVQVKYPHVDVNLDFAFILDLLSLVGTKGYHR